MAGFVPCEQDVEIYEYFQAGQNADQGFVYK